MVDIVFVFLLVVDHDHAANEVNDIPFGDAAVGNWNTIRQIQFLIEFIAAHSFEVVVTHIEDLLFKELFGVFEIRRVTRAHAPEEFDQGCLSNSLMSSQVPNRFLPNRFGNELAIGVVIDIMEESDQFFVRARLQRALAGE